MGIPYLSGLRSQIAQISGPDVQLLKIHGITLI